MAVRIVDGNPGAGKTYWAVHHLLKQYFEFEKDLGKYFLKEKYKDVIIITNIDSLTLPHESLDDFIAKCNQENELQEKLLEKFGKGYFFFSHDYQEKLAKELNAPVVYVIDEAQRYFHKRYYYRPVFEWFELHRHFQQDIFLVTQKYRKLAPDILDLCEIVVHGIARTRSLTGKEFRYKHLSEGDVMRTEVVMKNKEVFALYKSMMGGKEVEKIDNPLIKKVVLIFICVFAFGAFGVYRFTSNFGGGEKKTGLAHASVDGGVEDLRPGQVEASPFKSKSIDVTGLSPIRYTTINKKTYIIYENDVFTTDDFPHTLVRKGCKLYAQP